MIDLASLKQILDKCVMFSFARSLFYWTVADHRGWNLVAFIIIIHIYTRL